MQTALSRRTILGLAALAPLAGRGQIPAFPTKVVRIVVPFSPGGSADASARILAEQLAEMWRQPVIIDNRPGAGTTIASAHVAQSAPDGHTLYLAYVLSYATSASLYAKLPYDPATALAPVSLIADAPFILAVHAHSGITTVSEFVAQAKAAPQPWSYASTGNGAGPHLTTEMFLRRVGLRATHVPYRGTADALAALMGEQVQFSVLDAASLGSLRGARLRPLAVTSAHR